MTWCCVDTIETCLFNDEPFILNTDLSTGQGIHWISCMMTKHKILWIYDPLGRYNKRPNDRLLVDILSRHDVLPYFSENKSQFNDSTLCGYYAILVCTKIKQLTKKISPILPTCRQLEDIIIDLFDDDNKATISDELAIYNHFN